MRIAFFGGSFDPPHLGHLAIARAARERLMLDRVLLAPVGLQPLKQGARPASFGDRVAMVRLLSEGESWIEVSELDAPRADGLPNYSFETLGRLRLQMGLAAETDQRRGIEEEARTADAELFMLLGADSFLMMRQWYRAAELMMLCDWIVAGRPGFSLDDVSAALPDGVMPLGEAKVHERHTELALGDGAGRKSALYLLEDLQEDVSATGIRAALAGPEPAAWAATKLPIELVEYIRAHALYRHTGARYD